AEIGDGFRHDADALFVFGRKKKWAQKRAVDAVAEGELRGPQFCQKLRGEIRRLREQRTQEFVPVSSRVGSHGRGAARHLLLVPAGPAAGELAAAEVEPGVTEGEGAAD